MKTGELSLGEALAMTGELTTIDPAIFTGGKVIAGCLIDLLTKPELLAKAEFDERTRGGVGGRKWVPPLLPSDLAPPLDIR